MRSDRMLVPALLGVSVTLGGCVGPMHLQNGESSAMVSEGAALRNQLAPVPVRGVPLAYRPASCVYDYRHRGSTGGVEHHRTTMSVEAVTDDRLLVKFDGFGFGNLAESRKEDLVSTALIDRTGRVFSANMTSFDGKQRTNDTNFNEEARKSIGLYRFVPLLGAHYLNGPTLVIPHFLGVPRRTGVKVADVLAENDQVWGSYVYQGMVRHKGVQAELFDLLRQDSLHDVRGFLLFDTQHMVPLLLHVTMGFDSIELEQEECSVR